MSKFDQMNEALRPARDEEGYPVTQSDYESLRQLVAKLEGTIGLERIAHHKQVAELEKKLKSAEDGCNAHLNNHLACLDELAAMRRRVELYQSITTGYEHERVEVVLKEELAAAPKPEEG